MSSGRHSTGAGSVWSVWDVCCRASMSVLNICSQHTSQTSHSGMFWHAELA